MSGPDRDASGLGGPADGPALPVERHRVIVVGAGVAALSAALELGEATVVVDTVLGGGSSPWAQGGLAAALERGDTTAAHAEDTVTVSAGIGDRHAAEVITGAAPQVVQWLRSVGARFDTDGDGALVLGREAGHRARRIVHANGDATGAEIMRALVAAVREAPAVTVREHTTVVDLVRSADGGRIVGVVAADEHGELRVMLAGAVVLGTGGYGHLFAATTNPPQVCGAALAMATRAGVEVADAEMVQFHPTALAAPGADPLPLLTEALRGEGAVLVNDRGERYMAALHPDAELAPRDIVARGNYAELVAGRRPCLDARAAVGDRFPERFPTVFALAQAHGLDPRTDLLPVSPAAHYCMGGVATDIDGRTSKAGLWVVGEAASNGLHGANRLASNSLLEGVVMGRRVGGALRRAAPPRPEAGERVLVPAGALRLGAHDAEAFTSVRQLLWRHAGVVRDEAGLRTGLNMLAGMVEARSGVAGPTVRNAVEVAGLVLRSALARTESRGAHFRSDHPDADTAQATRRIVHPAAAPSVALEVAGDRARPAASTASMVVAA
ncbi:MAG: L-aspartate oxidase [Acidimicrobiia bacterium]